MERGAQEELSEEYIIRMYKLSKRKEHAFIEKLTDNNIKIFCGEVDPLKMDNLL